MKGDVCVPHCLIKLSKKESLIKGTELFLFRKTCIFISGEGIGNPEGGF